MNSTTPRGARGVSAPQQRVSGPPRTFVAASPIVMLAVRYFDAEGNQQDGVACVINNKYYFTPNHVEWARTLSPAPDWFQKQASKVLGATVEQERAPSGAEGDLVDVLPPSDD